MAKIADLPLVAEPDGAESVVILKGGLARRATLASLVAATVTAAVNAAVAAATAALNAIVATASGYRDQANTARTDAQSFAANSSVFAGQAAAVATLPRSLGQGTVGQAGGAIASNTAAYQIFSLDSDGPMGSVTVYCSDVGVGNIEIILLRPLGGGNWQEVKTWTTVWASTGDKTFDFAGYAGSKGWIGLMRRAAVNSGKYVYRTATAGMFLGYNPGAILAGATVALATNLTIGPLASYTGSETVKQGDNKKRAEQALAGVGISGKGAAVAKTFGARYHDITQTRGTYSVGLPVGPARPFSRSGLLTFVSFQAMATGFFRIIISRPNDSTGASQSVDRYIDKWWAVTTPGETVTVTQADFGEIMVEKFGRLHMSVSMGAGQATVAGSSYSSMALPFQIGDVVTPTLYTEAAVAFPIEYGIAGVPQAYSEFIDTFGDRVRQSTVVTNESFPGVANPASWTLGTWTVSNGLVSPAVGGWNVIAKRTGTVFNATRSTCRGAFVCNIASPALKFGLGSDSGLSGILLINTTNNCLELYDGTGSATAGTLRASVPIAFPTPTTPLPGSAEAIGRIYIIEWTRKRGRLRARLTDLKTMETINRVLNVDTNIYNCTRMKGNFGPVMVSTSGAAGDVTFLHFETLIHCGKTPHAIILGDSLTENSFGSDDDARGWGEIIDDWRGLGDVLVCATHGNTTTNIATIFDQNLAPFQPKFVIIHCVNDTNYATWYNNLFAPGTGLVAKIRALGAIPILGTPSPWGTNDDTSHLTTQKRNAVLASGERCIDFNDALSNDHINWSTAAGEAGYQKADGVHYTTRGTLRCANRAVAQQPALLSDSQQIAFN